MDDASKTREELLLEVQELRRQLAEGQVIGEIKDEVHDAESEGDGQQGPIITKDIRARQRASIALRQSEARYRSLVELSPEAIVVHAKGKIIFVNPAGLRMFGATMCGDLQNQSILDFIHPKHREAVREHITILESGGKVGPWEEKILRLDGESVEVEAVAGAIMYQGRPAIQAVFRDITERKRAREALRSANARLHDLIKASPLAIVQLDRKGIIQGVNPAAERIFGWSSPELLGRFLPIASEAKQKKVRNIMQRVLQGELFTGQEVRARRKDGSEVDLSLSTAPMYDGEGKISGIVGLAEDITARKRAEAALAKSRAEFEAIFNSMSDAVIFANLERCIVLVNPAVKDMFGYESRELMGKSASMLYAEQADFEAMGRNIYHKGPPGEEKLYEVRYRRKNGTVFQGETVGGRVKDIQGNILGFVGIHRDITPRKQAEEALRESEMRFRQLAENIDDAIFLVSGDWQQVHYISLAYERIWGRTCASLYNAPCSWQGSVVPEDQEQVRLAMKEHLSGDFSGKEFPQFRIRRPDGTVRWIALRFFPIKNEVGEIYRIAGIAADITARKEMEAVLRWRQEHLKQSAKMEAVGRLAGGVAHDFNNLLTVISGYGELLLNELKETDQKRKQVQAILKAADQANAVTRQLLAFSRKQVLQPQILDLNELISNMVAMLRRLIDENIVISTKLATDLGAVQADLSHMEQVVMNMAINALDAMPEGGSLIIETANIQVDHHDVRHNPEILPGSYVVVSVTDTGIGMNRKVLSHIFEPFFTTKERGQGTGLGLSMAYGIIKQSSGHILVESSPGKGSIFRIYLPRVPKPRKPVVVAPEVPALAAVTGKGTVLLVEDEEGVRRVVERMLTLKGFSVLSARDGQEALKICQEHQGPIHLLLTDVAMPVMGGRELAERLAPAYPKMRVLFMSGHTEDGRLRRGVQESVINFIQKPFRTDQLLSKIRDLLAE